MSYAYISAISEGVVRDKYLICPKLGYDVHPIFWRARKHRIVARIGSTTEFLAALAGVRNLPYLQKLLVEITYRPKAELFLDS